MMYMYVQLRFDCSCSIIYKKVSNILHRFYIICNYRIITIAAIFPEYYSGLLLLGGGVSRDMVMNNG